MTGDTFGTQAAGRPNWKFSDITPVAIMIKQPSAFFVPMGSPIKTWNDLVAEAKKRPLKVAITGFGTPDDITGELLHQEGQSTSCPVPFANPGERYTAILGGHADLLYEQLGRREELPRRQADAPDRHLRRAALPGSIRTSRRASRSAAP
jgi:tripartite-type tricarboxylate transporter receptor subunit TctC